MIFFVFSEKLLENQEEKMMEDKQKFQKDTKKMQKLKVSKENSCFFIEKPLKKEDLAALTNEYQKSLSFRKFCEEIKKIFIRFF